MLAGTIKYIPEAYRESERERTRTKSVNYGTEREEERSMYYSVWSLFFGAGGAFGARFVSALHSSSPPSAVCKNL